MQRYADWITAHAGHSATELRAVARAVPLILSDLDTLLAENARLRAVAEAARELVSESRRGGCSCTQRWRSEESTASSCACCDAERDASTALAALEAP